MIEKVAMRGTLRGLVVVAAAKQSDPGKAVANVGGVGDLAELAVADAVSSHRDLLCDNLPDGAGEAFLERRLIKFAAGLPGLQQGQQLRRPRQAAYMGCQDAVGAELHLVRAPPVGSRMVSRAAKSCKVWRVAIGRASGGNSCTVPSNSIRSSLAKQISSTKGTGRREPRQSLLFAPSAVFKFVVPEAQIPLFFDAAEPQRGGRSEERAECYTGAPRALDRNARSAI